jgi:hypothetical protein
VTEQAFTKLTGRVLWMDLLTGETVDQGNAERAILRPDGLALDLSGAFGAYSISLRRTADLTFEGSWTCRSPRGEERGVADCKLDPKEGYFLLAGDWNRRKCHWFARLEKVEAF